MGLRKRSFFLSVVTMIVLTIVSGRLIWVQVYKAEQIVQLGEEMRLMRVDLAPLRGSIIDRNGRTLAVSVPLYTVVANAKQITDFTATAAKLAPALGTPADEIAKILSLNSSSGWIPLKRYISIDEMETIKALRAEGISLVPEAKRHYPQGSTLNQVIGYVDALGTTGEYGLEARYEKELRGEPGYVRAEVTGNLTPYEDAIKEMVPSKPGLDLVLTIDAVLQQMIEARLDQVVKEKNAKRAMTLVMNAHTGEILVMAMRPGAMPGDRNTWLNKDSSVNFDLLTNWAVSPLPPGSIFKTITTAIALEERTITLNQTFEDAGRLLIDGYNLTNWDRVIPLQPKKMNIYELMATSSNIGMIKIGQTIPDATWVKYMNGFGLMDKTGVDLSAEYLSNFGGPFEQKTRVDWANMYIGQHLEVTPIQILTAIAAIANGGHLVQPHLVSEIRQPDGKVVSTASTAAKRQVISQATAKDVQDIMVKVVKNGTANAADPKTYTVGGKTGTAQKHDPKTGKIKERNLADFIGFAPADNPELVMLVMVDEPEGNGYGGIEAAPLFKEFMPHAMRAVGILPLSAVQQGKEPAKPTTTQGVVPNIQYLPSGWAQELLARAGLSPRVLGTGPVVTAQSLKPGNTARVGTLVEVTMGPADPKLGDQVPVPDFTGLSIAEASQLSQEIGLTIKAGGSGFVVDQQPKAGTWAPARSSLTVRLEPPPR